MTGSRIFIVVLVLIGVLYAVVVVLGIRDNSEVKVDSAALDAAWLKALQDRFAQPHPVKTSDIGLVAPATCLVQDQVVVPSGGVCKLLILSTDSPSIRRLSLTLEDDMSAHLKLEQKNALTLNKTLPAADSAKDNGWDVYKEGGVLSIVCLDSGGAPACKLKLN